MAERLNGTVKWFSGPNGFGFVSPDGGDDDLYVHQTEIQSDGFGTLREGQRVEFKVGSGEDGRSKAVDVVIILSRRDGGGGDGYGGYQSYGRGRGRGRSGRGRGGGSGRGCYNCGEEGHFARDCLVEQSFD